MLVYTENKILCPSPPVSSPLSKHIRSGTKETENQVNVAAGGAKALVLLGLPHTIDLARAWAGHRELDAQTLGGSQAARPSGCRTGFGDHCCRRRRARSERLGPSFPGTEGSLPPRPSHLRAPPLAVLPPPQPLPPARAEAANPAHRDSVLERDALQRVARADPVLHMALDDASA